MHLHGRTYDEVCSGFRWEVPARFNIASAISEVHAAARPDAPALIVDDAAGGARTWSFGEIETQASRLANAMAGLGLGRGDVVGVHLPQCPECLITHIATLKLGAIVLPLFRLFGPDALAYRLQDSAARMFVTSAANWHEIAQSLSSLPDLRHVVTVGDTGSGAEEFWRLASRAASTRPAVETSADDPAVVIYTSGTTGNPKGALHAHRVLIGHLPGVMLPQEMFPQAGDRYWTPADWAWIGGLLDVLWPSLYCGVPVVASTAKFDPEWAFSMLARHGVRNAFLPPTALRMMRQVPDPGARHGYRMRSIASGGETLGADLIDWGRDTFGLTINEFYGQTEVNLVVGNCQALFPAKPGSMGRAIPGHRVAIVDEEGREVADGTPGVVAVKRPDPVMFLGYLRNPEATAAKFRGDWCLLGDVAVRDGEGHLWFRGRDDDIINSAGYRIGPGEVEECLARHPAVALAGVVGARDPVRGEVVVAFIVLRAGVAPTPDLAEEIQDFVRRRLAAHEYPRQVRFVADLPMTVTGKIKRGELRRAIPQQF